MQTASRQIAQQITNKDLFLPDCGLSYLEVEGGGGRGGGGGRRLSQHQVTSRTCRPL